MNPRIQVKAQIAGNDLSIVKIGSDETVHFTPKMHAHEWIRGSLSTALSRRRPRPISRAEHD